MLLTGVTIGSIIQTIINAFKTRVAADGGTFEAESCLNTKISSLKNIPIGASNAYDQASLIVTPNAYKATKIYSVIPNLQATFLTMGDSLTQSNGGQWQYRLAGDLMPKVWGYINKGIPGNNTTQMLARFATDILANAKVGDYVTIWGGVNDLSQDVPLATIQSNLQAMYDAAHNAGLIVISLNIAPWKGSVNWTSGRQAQMDLLQPWIAAATNVDYKIDVFSATVDPSVANTLLPAYDDGGHLHMTQAGYNAVGDAINAGATFVQGQLTTSSLGDLTVSRSTVASRGNSSGKWETAAVDVPRLSYPVGGSANGCPMFLFEPQSTSLMGYSKWSGGGAIPTGWNGLGSGSSAINGTSIFFEASEGVIPYKFTCAANYYFFYAPVSVTSGTTYTMSCYVEDSTGSLAYSDVLLMTGVGFSSQTYRFNGVVVNETSVISGTGLLELIAVCNSTGTAYSRIGAGVQGGASTGTITLTCPQFEAAACASSPILTDAASATRAKDVLNTFVTQQIGQIEGLLYVEFMQSLSSENDVIVINQSGTNGIGIYTTGDGHIGIGMFNSGAYFGYNSSVIAAPATKYKVAFGYKSGASYLSINGVGSVVSNTFTFNGALETLRLTKEPFYSGAQPTLIGPIITRVIKPTNAELNAMTV